MNVRRIILIVLIKICDKLYVIVIECSGVWGPQEIKNIDL